MTDENKAVKILKKGSELVGSAVGGALGFLAGGPIGAAGGAAAGTMCGQALSEIADRMLSQKEQIRIGAAAAIALSEIQERLGKGENFRNDDFFNKKSNGHPSNAEELFEGVLLKARDEHEEKKVKFFGKFYSNLAFDGSCTTHEANFALNTAESLTYAQLCLLNIYQNKSKYNLRADDLKPGEQVTYASLNCLQQSFDLFKRGYLLLKKPGEGNHSLVLEINQITPAYVDLSVNGSRLYQILSLKDIDADDITITASFLQRFL